MKRTKYSNKWNSRGKRKNAIRLSDNNICLLYDLKKVSISGTEIVGADQGILTTLTLSNGSTTQSCLHGHNLKSIQAKLARKKKGSKGFRRAQAHRKNYINWSLNQLNFKNIREIRFEEVKYLRYGRRCSRYLTHWSYTLIKNKVIRLSEEEGFLFHEVKSEFRSQRCSKCGWVRKANRKGKMFKCNLCGLTLDADLNAASNLKANLYEVPLWVRLSQINRKGFFWNAGGLFDEKWEPIVPTVLKN